MYEIKIQYLNDFFNETSRKCHLRTFQIDNKITRNSITQFKSPAETINLS